MASAILNMGKSAITSELETYVTQSQEAITAIGATKQPDSALQADYEALKADLQATIDAEAATDVSVYTSKLVELKSRFDTLNTRKVQFLASANPTVYTLTDLAQMTYGNTLNTILFFLMVAAVILGGTVASHLFLDERLVYRIYYFAYGAALFPFSLAYAIFDPPYWRATLFPWILKGEEASVISKFPLSLLWNFIAYSSPSPLDKETLGYTKGLLRMFSGGILGLLVVFYFLVFERLPL